MILLDRDDLIDGLRELVAELHAAGRAVGLRIVGGGALALRTSIDAPRSMWMP